MTDAAKHSLAKVSPKARKSEGKTNTGNELRQFSKRHRLLDAWREDLVRKYPDQWVAFTSNGTIVAGPTIEELCRKLDSKGLCRRSAAVKFMATVRRRVKV